MASALSAALIEEDPGGLLTSGAPLQWCQETQWHHLKCSGHAGNLDDLLKLHVREAVRSQRQAGRFNGSSVPYSR